MDGPAMNSPPLYAIKVFEIAARHESFKQAAIELSLTAGAVSRQIALLEVHLGTPLFHRLHREVRLTASGKDYWEQISEPLQQLSTATGVIRQRNLMNSLHIWCPMTFSLRWLIPRLMKFQVKFPECHVTFSTTLAPVDYRLNNADVAIRIGRGNWPNLSSRKLIDIELVPVCSPAFLADHPLASYDDLHRYTLLHSMVHPDYWKTWLRAMRAERDDTQEGIRFGSVSLAYQFAKEGYGIAIAQHALVVEDLESGALVAPFAERIKIPDAFYLIHSDATADKYYAMEFRAWLEEEAAAFEAQRQRPGPPGTAPG